MKKDDLAPNNLNFISNKNFNYLYYLYSILTCNKIIYNNFIMEFKKAENLINVKSFIKYMDYNQSINIASGNIN